MKLRYALAISALIISTTASAEINICAPEGVNRDIAERYELQWEQALRGTPGRLADLYAESAVLMPPTDETLVGQQPIADYLEHSAVPAHNERYQLELVSCQMIGDSLHVAAVWGLPHSTAGTQTGETWISGNMLRVLKPNDQGNWVSAYEIWN